MVKKQNLENGEYYLMGILILLLLIFSFLWYSQLTETSDGLINFIKKSFTNMGKIFSEDVQAQGQSPLEQFNIFPKQRDYFLELEKYNEKLINTTLKNSYDSQNYKNYKITPKFSQSLPYKFDTGIILKLFFFGEFFKILGKIFIIIGTFFMAFQLKKQGKYPTYSIIIFSCFAILSILVIMPFISIRYDLLRTYQQVLILLSLPAVLGSLFIFKFLKTNSKILLVTILFLFYFLFLSGFIPQITGGSNAIMRLDNFGLGYNMYYTHNEEILSGNWLFNNYNSGILIYADSRANNRIISFKNLNLKNQIVSNILPYTIEIESYIYTSYTNMKTGISFKSYNGNLLSYNFPIKFLNKNKNKIYANGGSEIFK